MSNSRNGYSNHPVSLVEPVKSADVTPMTSTPMTSTPMVISSHEHDWSCGTAELLDSLPRVWTRGLFYLLLLFASVLLPWALFSRVDETGTARGRLEPRGQTVQLDSEVTGTIASIQVEEGDRVAAGQPLLILESELVAAELRQVQEQQQGQRQHLSQLTLLRNQLRTTLATQQQQNRAHALEKETQIEQAVRRREHAQTELDFATVELTRAEEEVERYEALYQQGIIPEIEVIDHQNLLLERKRLYAQAQANVTQARLELQEHQQNYESLLHTNKFALLRI